MARKNNTAPDAAEQAETEITSKETPPETNSAPAAPPVPAAAPLLVCVGGYNFAAVASDGTLEIAGQALPKDFSMAEVKNGYFPGEFVQRFNIVSHKLDGKALRIVIAKQT